VKTFESRCCESVVSRSGNFLIRPVRTTASRSLAPGFFWRCDTQLGSIPEIDPNRSFATFQAVFWPWDHPATVPKWSRKRCRRYHSGDAGEVVPDRRNCKAALHE
jgi:hypothetical protein